MAPAASDASAPSELTVRIKAEAERLGFAACGVLPAGPAQSHAYYEAWLAAGYAGTMGYLQRHAPLKRDPRTLLPGARTVLALAHPYHTPTPTPPADGAPRGRVSRYAWGRDYHDVLHAKLARLAAFIAAAHGGPVRHKACVDSAPVMEREWAARAGLGWVGRNALLIHWRLGSWLFLAELLLDVALPPDLPPRLRRGRVAPRVPPPQPLATALEQGLAAGPLALRESCGSCTACLAACPTGAIVGDKTVDARRCISYLTIELKGPVPESLRAELGEWVFGCDVCQDVCPWNRRARRGADAAFQADAAAAFRAATEPAFQAEAEGAFPRLTELLGLDDAAFRARFRDTPLWRARRRGVLRNAALVLGNRLAADRAAGRAPPADALAALRQALGDAQPLVRGAAAWALGRSGAAAARPWLEAALATEADASVQPELRTALAALASAAAAAAPAPPC